MKKKLIEVALPLDAINAASIKEKSIRHGHPSTLHLWWARRPLAACRAVLFAQLVDDPSSHPDRFPTEADQDKERERLFKIIRELVKWENTRNEEVLNAARDEIVKSCDGSPPSILDPFAGGGSIPLEAQRLGLKAYASDLNPVAVLINKALIEIPPKFADKPPIHPEAEVRTRWHDAEGLAEDVRRYGQWIRDEAERRIGHLYPKATLSDGKEARIIAWIWTRTVTCPNPACRATMPLASSFWLSKKKGKEAWIKPITQGTSISYMVGYGSQGPPEAPKSGRGARFKCLCCTEAVSSDYIKAEGMARRMSQKLMAIVAQDQRQRVFLAPSDEHTADPCPPCQLDLGWMRANSRYMLPPYYGLSQWSDLYTNRQLKALTTYSELLGEVRVLISQHLPATETADGGALDYLNAIVTYLALAISRLADMCNSLCPWENTRTQVRHLFVRQAVPMVWDFAENNVFNNAGGDYRTSLNSICNALQRISGPAGMVIKSDATTLSLGMPAVICTDPPYYDNVGYADLSDFFYGWLRISLGRTYPELFSTIATPKEGELVAFSHLHNGSKEVASRYFENGFVRVFANAKPLSDFGFPMTLFYAFKQSENSVEGKTSTGWSTMLEGLIAAGWTITATWPIRTELANRMRGQGSNALATSVVLACRPRPGDASVTDRQGLLHALRQKLTGPIHDLQKAAVAPVDLRQAAIGPGMAVFSRYSRVVEPDGTPMRVHIALGLINQVLEAVLGEAEADLDPETRWAITWFAQHFEDDGPYGIAEQLAVSMNVAVDALAKSGILESGGGRVRLLSRDELPTIWNAPAGGRTPIWKATQHLVRTLLEDGEAAAGALLAQLDAAPEACRSLAYRLYTICETARPNLASPYNALAKSWPEIHRHSTQAPPLPPAPDPQLFNP